MIPRPAYKTATTAVPLSHTRGWRLSAEVDWVVEGDPATLDLVEAVLEQRVRNRLAEGLLLLTFGNQLGWYPAGPLGDLHVATGKWSEDAGDRLLELISSEAANLPFAAGSPSALPFDRSALATEDVLYHAFTWLRHVLGDRVSREDALMPHLAGILADPHRRLVREPRVVPVDRARRLSPRALTEIVAGRHALVRTSRGGPLAEALRGRLPETVTEDVANSTFDTAENRFVAAFLDLCAGTIERMRTRAHALGTGSLRTRVLHDCAWMERRLAPVARHPMWRQVGAMTYLPVGSSVLQRRSEYRGVFAHWVRMRLGSRLPVDPATLERMLEVKDVALLYEMWAYFAVVRAIRGLLGAPTSADRLKRDDLQVRVGWCFRSDWPGLTAIYNGSYTRGGDERRSWSVTLRPDVAVRVAEGPNAGLHVFDAKFRLNSLGDVTSDDEGLEDEERGGTFKRADLYKMHAYRDALVGAKTAWILYPGDEFRFYPRDGSVVTDPAKMPEVLEGVGAIPLGAHETCKALSGLLRQTLKTEVA